MEISDVFERVCELAGVKNDAALAKELGVTPQAVANSRKRGTIPYEKICLYAEDRGYSLDYLFYGKKGGDAGERSNVVRPALLQAIGDEIENQRVVEIFGFDSQQTYSIAAIVYTDLLRRLDVSDLAFADFSDSSSRISKEIQSEVTEYIRVTKETIELYQRSSQVKPKGLAPGESRDSSAVSQTFNAEVGQVGGGDINNFGNKDK